MGCSGKNISPSLSWKNAPKNTKSFAVTVFDPDVPIETGWTHWIIFNIPHNVNSLKAGANDIALKNYPQGSIQSVTSFGVPGYGVNHVHLKTVHMKLFLHFMR